MIGDEIVRGVVAAGIKTPRTSKDVISKIASIDSTFRTATDWLAATGQGVEEERSLSAVVLA